MVEEIQTMFQGNGGILGFVSAEIAWVYIGCILASLLCVVYGLIQWNRDGKSTRVRRARRVKKGGRPRRRR